MRDWGVLKQGDDTDSDSDDNGDDNGVDAWE